MTALKVHGRCDSSSPLEAMRPVSHDLGSALEGALIGHCRSTLAHYKCPRSVDFMAELPRADNGKLFKRLLRDPFWAGRGPSRII